MRAAFFTLGCKVNQYETSVMMQQFSAAGFSIVDAEDEADVYIINSCTVTAGGDKKSRQALRRMKRQNPVAVCCLCGCFPQAFPDIADQIPEADIIMGSKNRGALLAAVSARLAGGPRIIDIAPHEKNERFERMSAGEFTGHTRAFVKIEDGCNRYCAYCIIPTARGPVRSKPLDELKTELYGLAAAGHREVVLAGINLSCYGQDLNLRLIDAVRLACSVEGINRVRLSSLEPELLTNEDIAALAELPKLCPHFHLALQSGCDTTLRRMRRHYDTAEYSRIVSSLRAVFPHCSITTDVMVGFPGETDDEFAQSLAFCKKIEFAKVHVFAYSKRAGTIAANMPEQIPESIKRDRSKTLIAAMEKVRLDFLKKQLGRPVNVLFESKLSGGFWEGYSENYTPVRLASQRDLQGKIYLAVPEQIAEDGVIAFE